MRSVTKQLSGTANYLASYIAGEFGCKTRAIELSTLQRSASHCASRVDILEAYQVGGAAVKAADEGDSGKMVVLQRLSDDPYQCGTEVKDVHKIANDEKSRSARMGYRRRILCNRRFCFICTPAHSR